MYYIDSGEFFFSRRVEVGCWNSLDQEMVNASTVSMPSWRNYYGYKKAQLMLAYPRDAKTMKKFLHFEVITSSSQVGNPVFKVIKFLIQITSTYNNS